MTPAAAASSRLSRIVGPWAADGSPEIGRECRAGLMEQPRDRHADGRRDGDDADECPRPAPPAEAEGADGAGRRERNAVPPRRHQHRDQHENQRPRQGDGGGPVEAVPSAPGGELGVDLFAERPQADEVGDGDLAGGLDGHPRRRHADGRHRHPQRDAREDCAVPRPRSGRRLRGPDRRASGPSRRSTRPTATPPRRGRRRPSRRRRSTAATDPSRRTPTPPASRRRRPAAARTPRRAERCGGACGQGRRCGTEWRRAARRRPGRGRPSGRRTPPCRPRVT